MCIYTYTIYSSALICFSVFRFLSRWPTPLSPRLSPTPLTKPPGTRISGLGLGSGLTRSVYPSIWTCIHALLCFRLSILSSQWPTSLASTPWHIPLTKPPGTRISGVGLGSGLTRSVYPSIWTCIYTHFSVSLVIEFSRYGWPLPPRPPSLLLDWTLTVYRPICLFIYINMYNVYTRTSLFLWSSISLLAMTDLSRVKSRRGEHLCARAIQIPAATEVSKLSTTAIHFHGLSALCRW